MQIRRGQKLRDHNPCLEHGGGGSKNEVRFTVWTPEKRNVGAEARGCEEPQTLPDFNAGVDVL